MEDEKESNRQDSPAAGGSGSGSGGDELELIVAESELGGGGGSGVGGGGGSSSNNNNTRVKGPCSPEEDAVLSRLVAKFGARNWSLIARGIPGRSGKSCRLRWCNQLDPCLKRKPFTGVEIPKFVDTVTPQYKPKFDALLVELKEAEEKSLKESERLEKEIAEVQELKQKISTMTADEYFEKHPELKKKFDDEIRNDYWGY